MPADLLYQFFIFSEDAAIRLIVTVIKIFPKVTSVIHLTLTSRIYFLQSVIFLLLNQVFAYLLFVKGLEASNMPFAVAVIRW